MGYSTRLQLKPFSEKYIDYYERCLDSTFNCLEGAYRSGKTMIQVYSFANYLDHCVDKFHLVSGATSSLARLTVSELNGFGLTSIFRGRCRTGKYEGNECLTIDSRNGKKVVIFVGGGKSDSFKAIQGLAFGSWLATELANHYISDDEKDFVAMALSRLAQSHEKKVWWDLNPVYESHPVYTKYINRFINDPNVDFNFMRCSLFDNAALTEEQINSQLSLYPDKDSVEYKRGILGLRAYSEGIIFTLFARNPDDWIVHDMSEVLKTVRVQYISVGVDFGGNGSNTAFCATLICNNFTKVIIIADDEIDMKGGLSDVSDFRSKLSQFLLYLTNLGYGYIKYIFADSADPVMINEINGVLKEIRMYGKIRVSGSDKATIRDRIRAKQLMIAKGSWLVSDKATHVIDSTKHQVWSNKQGHEDDRLDNGSVDIDIADAEEYSWSSWIAKLIK